MSHVEKTRAPNIWTMRPQLVLVLVLLTVFILGCQDPSQVPEGGAKPALQVGQEYSGALGRHQYWFQLSAPDTLAALFVPRLPRDDQMMVQAVRTIVQHGFGEDLSNVWPVPVERTLLLKAAPSGSLSC